MTEETTRGSTAAPTPDGPTDGAPADMEPRFDDVQAHYDLSDEFFGTFQDPSRTYSCAYYARADMTLAEAQLAKIDLALDKLELRPGMTLLDVGCGWGSMLARAVERFDVDVVGLTLSRNQAAYAQELLDGLATRRSRRVLLRGWEQFDEPVDRIVSIEAIEAFPQERYAPFFDRCASILPADGRFVLQAILGHPLKKWPELGIPVTMTDLRFMRFISKEIFPGGSVPGEEDVVNLSREAGFTLERTQFLDEHYVRTLDTWTDALRAHHDEAVAATSEEVYERYVKYLVGCSDFFGRKVSQLGQFTLVKA